MKRSLVITSSILILTIITLVFTGCKKKDNPVKYPQGIFPDSVYSLTGLNSAYDDYNSNLVNILRNSQLIIFSSNRNSSGGQFDLVQGAISYYFDQTNAAFSVTAEPANDAFYASVLVKANTTGNDFGPYTIFSSTDGYEYLFLASQTGTTPLDIYYLKYLPHLGNSTPDPAGPLQAKILNSSSDDAYISFDGLADSAFFSSNRGGNYDIYLMKRPLNLSLDSWLKQDYSSATKVDSINSSYEDKCPFFTRNVLLFASNRPGGMGGYDIYYSVFRKGNWSSPVNMGPDINTSSDEFRPVMGYNQSFSNMYIVFSSNRPGGKGGYDLYFTGVNIKY